MKKQTLDDVYRSYMGDIYRYLYSLCHNHHLAEDMMQETFYRAYLYLEECPREKIRPWLFRVAHNAFVDAQRKSSRAQPQDNAFFARLPGMGSPEQEVLVKEELDEVERVVSGLTENQRQAIVLYDYHGLSYQEAADIMAVTLGHFKVLLFRARQKVRQVRERDENHE